MRQPKRAIIGTIWMAAAVAVVVVSCVTAPVIRRPDAEQPAPGSSTIDLSGVYLSDTNEFVKSANSKPIKSVLVVISDHGGHAGGAQSTKIVDTERYGRMVRKALIRSGVNVITGEVRAKVEVVEGGALQQRKETLGEAEKLILLGRESGADSIIVFDDINPEAMIPMDIYINGTGEDLSATVKTPRTAKPSDDPNVIRWNLPAVVVRGKVVDTESANITAEFDVARFIYKDAEALKSGKAAIQTVEWVPVKESDVLVQPQACGADEHTSYQYVARYEKRDVRTANVRQRLSQYIPSPQEIDSVQNHETLEATVNQVIDALLKS